MSFPESADYVNQLDDQKPNGQDPISYGDDHIRLIKKAVHDSFPNVGGPVTADHTELSYVDGVTSSIQAQLDAGGAQILQNQNDISNNSSAITALDARVLKNESDIADNKDAISNQEIGDHADVEYNGAPEDGDVLVYENGKWTAKRVGGAGVTKMIEQPKTAGSFSGSGVDGTYTAQRTSNGAVTFTVPAGLKFILQRVLTSGSGRVYLNTLNIDGVTPYPSWSNNTGNYDVDWPAGAEGAGPLIEVKDSIQVTFSYLSSGTGTCRIYGIFVEDK